MDASSHLRPSPTPAWYKALSVQDCLQLQILLEAHPRLVLEGWEDDRKRNKDGLTQVVGLKHGYWRGRTAIHAAASRGSVKLVQTIVELFSTNRNGEWFLDNHSSNPASDSSTSDGWEGDTRGPTESLECKATKDVAKPWGESSTYKDVKGGETRSLAKLLATKDGENKVEALAMAVIDGNRDIIAALIHASLKCKSNPYEVSGIPPRRRQASTGSREGKDGRKEAKKSSTAEEESRMRKEELEEEKGRRDLRTITEEAMASFNTDVKGIVLEQYSQDTVFKGLPWQEFLFQFAISTTALDAELCMKIRGAIGMRVYGSLSSSPKAFRKLISGYPDDRGRIVSQVAGDQPEVAEVNPPLSTSGIEGGNDEQPAHVSVVQPGEDSVMGDARRVVREVTKEILSSLSFKERLHIEVVYSGKCDFNFLPIEEYLFHFTFTSFLDHTRPREFEIEGWSSKIQKKFKEKLEECEGDDKSMRCLRFLMLELQDGRGRTALHVAAEGFHRVSQIASFFSLVPQGEEHADWVNARNAGGRTALFSAVAGGDTLAISALLKDSRVNLNASLVPPKTLPSSDTWRALSTRHGLKTSDQIRHSRNAQLAFMGRRGILTRSPGFTGDRRSDVLVPIHMAILNNHVNAAKILLVDDIKERRRKFRLDVGYRIGLHEPLAVAVAIGNAAMVQLLVKDERAGDAGRSSKWWKKQAFSPSYLHETDEPALHVAASMGRFDLMRCLLDVKTDKFYDPFVKNLRGQTAMHHVTRWHVEEPFQFQFRYCTKFLEVQERARWNKTSTSSKVKMSTSDSQVNKRLAEKRGCVELLLQAGLDVWTTDNAGQAPHPDSAAPPEFFSWWYEKLAKETSDEWKALNAAANAISVTATLVATASFVGPLQPPLSYSTNAEGLPSEIQVRNIWVRFFITCDTLSFYLAVAAIILAIIPSLPISHQSVRMELENTRRIVTLAVGFLFPSIIFVLGAFAASSMAVIPNDHGGLKMSISILGGIFSLMVISLFSIRILGLVFHNNNRIKKLYGRSIFLDKTIHLIWKDSLLDIFFGKYGSPLFSKGSSIIKIFKKPKLSLVELKKWKDCKCYPRNIVNTPDS